MEDVVCAFHDLVERARLEEVCFMEGQLSGERCAEQLEVLNLLLLRQASHCAANIVALLEELLHNLSGDIA